MTRRRLACIACVLAVLWPRAASAQSEVVEYYALDAIGSVRVVFDVNGNVIGRMDYDPFGAPLSSGNGLPSRAYAGLFRDGEAGMDFAQARSYQSRTGRFSTLDPIYSGLFEPQAWNRYAYALNSPLIFADPTGLVAEGCSHPQGITFDPESKKHVIEPCRDGDGGGGGGGGGLGSMILWFVGRALDTVTLASPVNEGGDLYETPKRGYKPSGTVAVVADVVILGTAVLTGRGSAAKGVADDLARAATSAATTVGAAGRATTRGTLIHTAFRANVEALRIPGVQTEVSYLNGIRVPWGTPGSVRLDVVQFGPSNEIRAVYDLKTGMATMSEQRTIRIVENLPPGPVPPIIIIRP